MKKILIIEDEVDTAKVLAKRVGGAGYDVSMAYDAYGGLAALRKEQPDLILLDLMLPAGGGISVLENMTLSGGGREVPVIVLTASKDERFKDKVLKIGVEAFMEKPYDPEELLSTIKKVLGEEEA